MKLLETLEKISSIFIGIAVFYLAFLGYHISKNSLELTEQSTYISLYALVEKHHSKEITDLRNIGYDLESKCNEAQKIDTYLEDFDEAFHSEVTAIINYYESVSMFLKYRWEDLPENSKEMMLAMLHNSTSKLWPIVNSCKDTIYPRERSPDWAQSFNWLYMKSIEYRNINNFGYLESYPKTNNLI